MLEQHLGGAREIGLGLREVPELLEGEGARGEHVAEEVPSWARLEELLRAIVRADGLGEPAFLVEGRADPGVLLRGAFVVVGLFAEREGPDEMLPRGHALAEGHLGRPERRERRGGVPRGHAVEELEGPLGELLAGPWVAAVRADAGEALVGEALGVGISGALREGLGAREIGRREVEAASGLVGAGPGDQGHAGGDGTVDARELAHEPVERAHTDFGGERGGRVGVEPGGHARGPIEVAHGRERAERGDGVGRRHAASRSVVRRGVIEHHAGEVLFGARDDAVSVLVEGVAEVVAQRTRERELPLSVGGRRVDEPELSERLHVGERARRPHDRLGDVGREPTVEHRQRTERAGLLRRQTRDRPLEGHMQARAGEGRGVRREALGQALSSEDRRALGRGYDGAREPVEVGEDRANHGRCVVRRGLASRSPCGGQVEARRRVARERAEVHHVPEGEPRAAGDEQRRCRRAGDRREHLAEDGEHPEDPVEDPDGFGARVEQIFESFADFGAAQHPLDALEGVRVVEPEDPRHTERVGRGRGERRHTRARRPDDLNDRGVPLHRGDDLAELARSPDELHGRPLRHRFTLKDALPSAKSLVPATRGRSRGG